MIAPNSRRQNCDGCHAYLPCTPAFKDRNGETLWFCHQCIRETPTPDEIDQARNQIRDAWSPGLELSRRFDCATPLARRRLWVHLDAIYTVAVDRPQRDG